MGTKAICIDAEPAEVWATLSSFESISGWAPNVDHALLLTEQRDGVGMTRRIQQGSTVVIETVTEWDPPNGFQYTIDGLPSRVGTVTNRWQVASHGDHCEVLLTATAGSDAKGPAKLVGKAVAAALGRVNATMLNGLKAHLESDDLDPTGDPT
jgi:hypothetical protein